MMVRTYEIIRDNKLFVPIVREGGFIRRLCKHRHWSEREARKCLTKIVPPSMQKREE